MSTPDAYVASLERRIAQLESTIASLPQGEQAVPNYLSTDAAGNVSASFPGGLEIVAESSAPFALAGHAVRWHKDTVTGSLVADVAAAVAVSGADTGAGIISLEARNASAVATAALDLISSTTPATNRVDVYAGGLSYNLMKGDGWSDFIMKVPPNDQVITAHDIYLTAGAFRGAVGGTSGASIGCRGGNVMSFNWTGNVEIWVDSTLVRTF